MVDFSDFMDDKDKIEELLTRSVSVVYPNKEALKEVLLSGKKLRIYNGIDPTATYVHLGHATNYLILKRFQELGHKIIILVGDFTAMIGDPSDKSAARKRLTKEEVLENLKTFKEQISKVINFDDKDNPVEFRFNSEWLRVLDFEKIAELASHFTVQQMIERDNFQKRLKENKPLYVHEFLYPLMQGYDSVALEADMEIGGTDQTFNMLAGRTLVKAYQSREKFVITTTLLEHPVTKEKLMSKSLGTGIGLDEEPNSMFGKVMAMDDLTMIQLFTDCTNLSMDEINQIKDELEKGANPKEIKVRLAKEIVKMYHSEEEAEKAAEEWENTFSRGEFPENAPVVEANKEIKIGDALVEKGIIESKSEFRRLIESGAVSEYPDIKITDPNALVEKDRKIKVGKKIFVQFKTTD
jgi:tyrosyl-tRNA synthetase